MLLVMNSKIIFTLLCVTLWSNICLYSCEQDSNEQLHTGVAASFNPTIAESTAKNWDIATRATDNQWTGTERVGIVAFNATSGTQYTTKYHQYVPNGGASGARVQLVPATDETAIYYPVNGSKLTFTAFAPYPTQEDINNGYASFGGNLATYNLDRQSTEENIMEKLDFIFHRGTTGYNQEAPVAALNFQHKLSRVIINLTRGSNYSGSIEGTVANIAGALVTVRCNTTTGEVESIGGGAINVTPFRTSNTESAVSFQAIAAPQNSAFDIPSDNRTLTFTVNNTAYTVSIPQDWESGKSYTYDFVFDISGLTLAGSTVVNWGAGTVAWDQAGNVLTAPSKVTHYKAASTGNTLVITTTSADTPVVSYSTSATSITGSATVTAYLTRSTFTRTKLTSPYEWTLTYNLATNSTGTDRMGYIWVSIGAATIVIELTQVGTITLADSNSNCYMVVPGATIHFPVTRAIAHGGASELDTFTADKLWDDTSNWAVATYSIDNTVTPAVISVTAGSNPGNALIAAKVNGITRWSWHIWVTEYNPYQGIGTWTNTYNTNNNGNHFVFMDRNLGATFAGPGSGLGVGLFYQWGRKDPFPSTEAPGDPQPGTGSFTALDTSEIFGTVSNTIQNPSVFYGSINGTSNDWHYANRNNTLWGHNDVKSIYDPCPIGWRIPINSAPSLATSPWAGFVVNGSNQHIDGQTNTGSFSWTNTYGVTTIYPMNGRRGDSGNRNNQGNHFWMQSASNCMTFVAVGNALQISQSYHRSEGYSVRCVKE